MPERGYEKYAFCNIFDSLFSCIADKQAFKPTSVVSTEFGEPSLDLLNEEKRDKVLALIKSGFVEGR